jgi:hypothetical protein
VNDITQFTESQEKNPQNAELAIDKPRCVVYYNTRPQNVDFERRKTQ